MAFFDGRAVLPLSLPVPGIDRFTKQFAIDADDLELRGRVDVRKGWLGNTLYPLYFAVVPKGPVTVAGSLGLPCVVTVWMFCLEARQGTFVLCCIKIFYVLMIYFVYSNG